jgi:hypothetical protein
MSLTARLAGSLKAVVGDDQHRPLRHPEAGDPGAEAMEVPDQLGAENVAVKSKVLRESGGADIEVFKLVKRGFCGRLHRGFSLAGNDILGLAELYIST